MLKCKICGKEFEATNERHYIARDNCKTGLVNIVSNDEVKMYDAFNCPSCGCQVIAQERKRDILDDLTNDYVDDKELNFKEEEHDGCLGCKFESKACYVYPCKDCKGTKECGTEAYRKAKDYYTFDEQNGR